MATFNWPGFGIAAIKPTLDQPAQVNRSAYTGVRAVASNPWHGKWSFEVQLARKQGDANFQAIRAFFTQLQGSVNNFHLPAVEAPQNSNSGVTLSAAAAQGANSLALTGLTTALAAGNMVTIAGQLLSLTSVGTLSAGAQTISFYPLLRAAAASGASVETAKPYALVALNTSSFSWDIASWRLYGLTFTADEDVSGTDGASPSGDMWTAPVISGTGGLNTPTDVVTALAAPTGAGMVGFNPSTLYSSTSIGGQLRRFTDAIRFWGDFGIVADNVTDDAAAVNAAFAWCGPGKTLFMPGTKIKIGSTVTYGNGTATSPSTIGNNCRIVWGGGPSNPNALIDTSDPWYSTAQSGTHFVWAGAAGGTMFQVNGPIQGSVWVGTPTCDGGVVSSGGSGAANCFVATSFSSCSWDSVVAVNWQAGGRGVLISTVSGTGIGTAGANSVLSSGNMIGRIFAHSPYGNNGECVRLDGYRAANGPDFTVSKIGLIECGISGTGAKGLVTGYCDDIEIGGVVNTVYGSISGSPWGIYLDGTATPFPAPARVYIHHAAVGQGLTVGGSTSAQVVIGNYELDDGATLPSIAGLYIRNICKSGSALDQMFYPGSGQLKTRALGNGEGFYGLDGSGTHLLSLSRQGIAAHVAGFGDVEFEAGATGGPTTGKHFKVTITGAGYPTGVGGAITQATSRTTGVTLNTVCGQITLFSAAGSATWATFTVTNSNVAATDLIRLSQASGTDKYMLHVTGVRAGAFDISFATTGGTTTEQPVFNFAVLKASAS